MERASPRLGGRGGGVALGKEVVGGGTDIGEIVDLRIIRQGCSETSERCLAGDGGGCDRGVKAVFGP